MKINQDLPKVSVMIITYNQAHLLKETLESVISQTYDNLEVVVSDDGSTDNSKKILLSYQENYPHLFKVILNEKNLGITANCNRAFFACTGDFVAILGGDDLFLPRKIELQVKEFSKDDQIVLSYHPVEIFDSITRKAIYVTNQNPRENTDSAEEIIIRGGIPGASSVMVRRTACPTYGFDQRLPTVSDWKFYIDVALKGKVVRVKEVLGKYRKHDLGVSNRTFTLLEESLKALDIVAEENSTDLMLLKNIKKGKARYLAGECYRQLAIDRKVAEKLIVRALAFDFYNFRLHILRFVVKIPIPSIFGKHLFPKMRYIIKRYFM